MKNFSNSRLLSSLIFFLIVGVIAKVIWLAVSMIFLPKSGVEHIEVSTAKALFYRAKLANKSKEIKVKTEVKAPVSPVIGTMKGIELIALYNSSDALVVTVEKAKKTKVLSKGEDIDKFVLSSAGPDYAIFKKNNKDFKLILKGSKSKNPSSITVAKPTPPKPKKAPIKGIVKNEDGEGKVVSKGLLSSYTKDIDKVWKDIGIGENKVNGQLKGFKVNFVKKSSDFEKLGLKRGDILTAVNGQELNSYNAAFSFYKDMEDIENLTLSIQRNNQDMELEYEIK
jgi:general secretion pathway protein C